VIIGITESIGPQANLGNPGSENAFHAFLKRFLNMQSNDLFSGENTAIYGEIQQNCKFESIEQGRELVTELDALVEKVIYPVLHEGKIPIVIGGGHNNAFPLIASSYKVHKQEIAVLNLDPHADCRKLEGRHSGNPFSYAQANGFLDTYSVIGLHKAYSSNFQLNFLKENKFDHTFFEDYIGNDDLLISDINKYCDLFTQYDHVGTEIDLDSICHMPSSAFSPSGITLEMARYYIQRAAQIPNLRYMHLPEGAPTNEYEEKVIGKTLAYLVWDFLHARTKNFM
jgi:formiminoglutamase